MQRTDRPIIDEFLALFWNLDQVFGWAETRDPEIVRAAALPRYNPPKPTLHIQVRTIHTATALLRDGRDVGGELWAASGWSPKIEPFDPPPILKRYAETTGRPAYRSYWYKDKRVEEPFDAKLQKLVDACRLATEEDRAMVVELIQDLERGNLTGLEEARLKKLPIGLRADLVTWLREPKVQGPPNVYTREPFPTLKYLESLFRTGRLKAVAQVPGEPHTVEISIADWSGLMIGVGGRNQRMSVWREGHFQTIGEGDFENVRVARAEVLREFPSERPASPVAEPQETTDETIRTLIREAAAARGGFVSQEIGAKIVRARFSRVGRDRARELVKQVTHNEKRGPKGPRRKEADNSADLD